MLESTQAVDDGSHYGNFEPRAQLRPTSLDSLFRWIRRLLWRKFRAEHYWDAALFPAPWPPGPVATRSRGHEFLTSGIDAGETDKLKTCRHGE